jgi:predicted translin family RNA/ssDNA-binding protein
MAKKDWTPEDRERAIALLREIRQDVRWLIQLVEAKRRERPSGA